MSVKKDVLNFLQSGKSLTALEALSLFGTMNLRNRISELRAEGYPILDEEIRGSNGKRFNKYFMEKTCKS